MNQTPEQLAKEYIRKLRKKMKLFREYPELFDDEDFTLRYVQEGDRYAALAFLYERLSAKKAA